MGRETFSVESYHAARRTYGVDHAVGVTKRAEQQARETGHLSEIVDPAIKAGGLLRSAALWISR